jgi:hypothetical protein
MFTYGCDPELFVQNAKNNFISAHGLIPGTKEEPFKVPGGAVQVDGMAVEFNIDPVDNVIDWENNISQVLSALRDMLPGCTLVSVPSAIFTPKIWEETPEEAKELGCNPDFNAYTGQENPRPNSIQRVRGAGGHIHIGWRKEADIDVGNSLHLANCQKLVKQLDRYVGFPSLKYDLDRRRRKMYGMAGAYRPKPYGVEYRTPSNFWALDPDLRAWVFNMTKLAVAHSLPSMNLKTPSSAYGYINDWRIRRFGGKHHWTAEEVAQDGISKPSGRNVLDAYLVELGFAPFMVEKVPEEIVKEYTCAAQPA